MKGEHGIPAQARALTRKQAVETALSDPIAKSAASTPLIERRRTLYAESAGGVLADLAAVGFPDIEEVGELHRRGIDYRTAVPVLIEWLPKVRYLLLAEDIVRTLSVRFAGKWRSRNSYIYFARRLPSRIRFAPRLQNLLKST